MVNTIPLEQEQRPPLVINVLHERDRVQPCRLAVNHDWALEFSKLGHRQSCPFSGGHLVVLRGQNASGSEVGVLYIWGWRRWGGGG